MEKDDLVHIDEIVRATVIEDLPGLIVALEKLLSLPPSGA